MSDTPRTDAFHDSHLGDIDSLGENVLRDQWYVFACQLERELVRTGEREDALLDRIDALKRCLQGFVP